MLTPSIGLKAGNRGNPNAAAARDRRLAVEQRAMQIVGPAGGTKFRARFERLHIVVLDIIFMAGDQPTLVFAH